jgi:hypothetical protein
LLEGVASIARRSGNDEKAFDIKGKSASGITGMFGKRPCARFG